ncbi:FAD-dependent monooxygenase [Rhodoplanes sp. Z2-YC6860]|uniref:FAD-dependent monooxygenase n=1 Tax=Rhodoplanes sp. Z2-YC6860 TaxID=674703 RepID=UPI00078EAF1B|nr:FAD-dependent monooxygenase [Rhodoplanes sp. Z2-YC6860]AMN45506.1 salicylate 1-monooxygenase [Rhodoplanes sp. Z2-YC6860]
MAPRDISIGVIGGGIGGLAAAIHLLRAGYNVRVYEQARWISEVGAGINIGPNASKLLIRLGLGEECAKVAFRSPFMHQRRWQDGKTLTRTPLGDAIAAEFGAPHYIFHRGDLHAILAKAVPPERVFLAHRCTGIEQIGDRVRVDFANGTSAEFDAVIAADGIHSSVRKALLGPEEPRFACRAYRGLIPAEKVSDLPRESVAWLGPGRHFIHYFVSGGKYLNFVGHVEQDGWRSESWTEPGSVDDLREAYAGWHPQVQRVIDAVDETFIWAVFDREPLKQWTYGRITMLGDCCHPMLPFMGQGGAQAIEDGAAIAVCFDKCGDDVEAALKLYEAVRQPRASRIQQQSWDNKTRFHMPDGPGQIERDAAMVRGMTDWSYRAVAWVYAHDAGVLPERPEAPPAAGH